MSHVVGTPPEFVFRPPTLPLSENENAHSTMPGFPANTNNRSSVGEGDAVEEENTEQLQQHKKERKEIIHVDQIWNKAERKFVYKKIAQPKKRKEKFRKYVITVARRISTQGTFEGHYVVDIRGDHITTSILEFYRDVDSVRLYKPITLETPSELRLLYHALPTLEKEWECEDKESAENRNPDKVLELRAAVNFTKEHFKETLQQLDLLPEDHIDFQLIWTLFPYNEVICGFDGLGQPRAYRVKDTGYKQAQDRTNYFSIEADFIDCNGERVGFVSRRQLPPINEFGGSMLIHNLPFFPLKLHPDQDGISKRIIHCADKILAKMKDDMKGRHLWEYKGHAIMEDAKAKFNSHGRVMVDPVGMEEMLPMNKVVPYIRTPIQPESLTDDQKILVNPLMYGFSLGDKVWGAFAVSRLEEVNWNNEIVDSLVLSDSRKDFISDLIRYHGRKTEAAKPGFDDFVRDKGKGLVGLLAGPPGVGKTLTAEAVAELAKRPLYMVSSGELGDTSSSVQNRLMTVLELAETWRAVVLLDEADVFLTERDDDNLSKNAITSIFLRHLEYYQGILLLTTNRLDSFDEAIKSRIHFCFEYEDLSKTARKTIWSKFLDKVEKDNSDLHIDMRPDTREQGIDKLAEFELNGRQIKNTVSISQAVATQRKKAITLRDILLAVEFAKISWRAKGEGDGKIDHKEKTIENNKVEETEGKETGHAGDLLGLDFDRGN
ncbi:P-loop containing nucleoside triphosphate hydrolase protein [Rhypophila decipiens]